MEFINELIPEPDNASPQQHRNIIKLREDAKSRYFDAPDLQGVGKNGYRFINAISDFSTHAKPLRERANYKEIVGVEENTFSMETTFAVQLMENREVRIFTGNTTNSYCKRQDFLIFGGMI